MKIVLGYDVLHNKEPSGVLGSISSYYGCVEAQGQGTLHCHMIIWLKGVLNCDQIHDKVLAHDNDFQSQIISFINDCISNGIPPPPAEPIIVPSDLVHSCSV